MGSIGHLTSAFQINLSDKHVGIIADTNVDHPSIDEANRLLQKNHEEHHIFFRDLAGHNHILHSILTCLALGAAPEDIQRAYDDGVDIQRPIPDTDTQLVKRLSDDEILYETLTTINQYTTFLTFFQGQIEEYGWRETVTKYLFSRTKLAERMLVLMYEGVYHPVIHLGFGIEFEQPCIIAEALAQAAAHDDTHIGTLFEACEAQAGMAYPSRNPKSLVQLLKEVRDNDTIRNAPHWEDRYYRMRDGVIGRACTEMAFIASQFVVKPENLQRRTAEMISMCAYMAGAAQRPGRKRKIDFYYMHSVTSSIFFSVIVNQEWIKMEDRVRMVEWKGRLDLAFYAYSGSPELYPDAITEYHDDFSAAMDWKELYAAVNKEHDDGHVVKFIRALKNGQEAARPFEAGEFSDSFPVKGDMWLKIARMALGTTKDCPTDLKFVMGTGFDMWWKIRPDLK